MKIVEKVQPIATVLFLSALWVLGMSTLLEHIRQSRVISFLFFSCILAPLVEEFMFRHFPLQTLKLIPFPNESSRTKAIMLVVLMSSLIFGLMHGNGWDSVLIQGVTGLGFSYVYLKNNYSYWSSVITHSLYNLMCLLYYLNTEII